VRLAPLLQSAPRRDEVVVTDVRSSWAVVWIMAVARAGIMDPFVNHTFQPDAPVRRVDLAQTVSRLLARVAPGNPTAARSWQSARVRFSDLSTTHLAYRSASMAVAAGVLTIGSDASFQPARPVSGAEAEESIARIEALARGPIRGDRTER
jgi:hypothetical protein